MFELTTQRIEQTAIFGAHQYRLVTRPEKGTLVFRCPVDRPFIGPLTQVVAVSAGGALEWSPQLQTAFDDMHLFDDQFQAVAWCTSQVPASELEALVP